MRSILRTLIISLGLFTVVAWQTPAMIQVGTVAAPLPAGAVVVPHPHGQGHFAGLRVKLEERLIVEVAALPHSELPLRDYVDSLRVARNARARPAWRLAPAEPRDVAGRTAWVLHPTCGDCQAIEVYIDFPGTRIVADWGVDGLDPHTAPERHAMAWSFVETFRPATNSTNPSGAEPSHGR